MEAENRSGNGSGVRPIVVFLLPAIFLLLFLPSLLSNGLRSTLVRNGWDALNLLLVSFAILCGLFARTQEQHVHSSPSIPPPKNKMRSSSSYPDLRQEASWWESSDTSDYTSRFSTDDIQLYRRSDPYSPAAKTIPVDTVEIQKSPSPSPVKETFQSPPPPPFTPPQPPPPPPRQSKKKTIKKIPPPEEPELPPRSRSPPKTLPPPPPPPPMSPVRVEIKKLERKKSGGAKDIATALAHFYQKKKKNGTKKIHIDELVTDTAAVSAPPPPPPPPPPPSVSMFQQLFKKSGSKSSKRRHHPSFPPPQPPPQNPPQTRKHKPPRSISSSKYPLPPSPLRPTNPSKNLSTMSYYSIPMPPPPTDEAVETGFCPSPDVNNKAEMFIARFRAGLQLEKLNSVKSKQQEEITVAA